VRPFTDEKSAPDYKPARSTLIFLNSDGEIPSTFLKNRLKADFELNPQSKAMASSVKFW